MEGRHIIVGVAIGAIALGWFIGRGSQGFAFPEMPQARAEGAPNSSGAETNKIDQIWQNVGQDIGKDSQAAIDTVKAWRDRANTEMENEPAPLIATSYPPANFTPMTFGPPRNPVDSSPSAAPATHAPRGSVSVGAGYPTGSASTIHLDSPSGSQAEPLPAHVTVSSPAR